MASSVKRKPLPNVAATSYSAVPSANEYSFLQAEFLESELDLSLRSENPSYEVMPLPQTTLHSDHEQIFAMEPDIPSEDPRSRMLNISTSPTPKSSSSMTVVEDVSPKGLSRRTGTSSTLRSSFAASWRKPTFILTMLICGLLLSLGHHFYYFSLTGTTAGNENKQAWPVRFGTAFAFLVTGVLQAATASAFGQYLWTIVKRRPLTIATLDKLFDLTRDPTGIFSLELLKGGKIAILFGLIFWLLNLAGIAPPATLTVVPRNITALASIPVMNYSQPGWEMSETGSTWNPEALTYRIAEQSAAGVDVVPLVHPVTGTDWSYEVQFYGPTLKCGTPNSTEQVTFDNYTTQLETNESTFIYSQVNDTYYNSTTQPRHLLYSAWTQALAADAPNSWFPFQANADRNPDISPFIYIQTSNGSIICRSYNASYDITVASINGNQQITQRNVRVIGDYNNTMVQVHLEQIVSFTNNQTELREFKEISDWNPYTTHFLALSELLVGNFSLYTTRIKFGEGNREYQTASTSTNMLTSGLLACDDIANSPFKNDGSNAKDLYGLFSNETFANTLSSFPWMCRNRSLALAIEDLANNVTISYLSSANLTSNDTTPRTIVTSNTINIYQYRAFWLVLSYGLALLFTAIAVAVGLYAIYDNGTSHSMSFSAIIAMTRNPELDSLTPGLTVLENEKRQEDARKAKLRFGTLVTPGGADGQDHERTAFGFEDSVGILRRETGRIS